ncbi:MAG: helix-turn-helix domain-containing protein [Syntrophomonadaceae bacterium]|nr:helix-turn-helix domain-containing protein [Syntrophomonadaceae bacterium]
MTVSKRIQKLRKERNLSQAMLAEKAGLKPPAISQYESGARSPSFESLVKLSNALGVPSDYLLIGEETPFYEEVGDSLSRLISHITGMLPFEKREMLLEYGIMLLKSGTSMLTLPYFSDIRSYADYIFHNICGDVLPVDLNLILNRLNVTLANTTLRDCEGLLVKGKENLILLDQSYENSQRQRFTIATLLGHLVIPWHTDTIYKARGSSSFKTEDPLEMEALQFAAHLLMPREVLAQDLSAATVSLDALRRLAGEKYDVSVFAPANSLVDMYPDKFAVVQSDGREIIKTFRGSRPVRPDLDPRSLAAGFTKSLPKKREMRTAKLEEGIWFQDGQPGAYVLEESIYDPQIGKVLTLLTVP